MLKSYKAKIIILIGVISIFLIYENMQHNNSTKIIKKNHSVYCGTIQSIGRARGGLVIKYELYINKKLLEFNSVCTKHTQNRFNNGDTNILVVIEKNNPRNNRLLESSDDFEKFNISPSDTLGLSCLQDGY